MAGSVTSVFRVWELSVNHLQPSEHGSLSSHSQGPGKGCQRILGLSVICNAERSGTEASAIMLKAKTSIGIASSHTWSAASRHKESLSVHGQLRSQKASVSKTHCSHGCLGKFAVLMLCAKVSAQVPRAFTDIRRKQASSYNHQSIWLWREPLPQRQSPWYSSGCPYPGHMTLLSYGRGSESLIYKTCTHLISTPWWVWIYAYTIYLWYHHHYQNTKNIHYLQKFSCVLLWDFLFYKNS